MLVNGAFDKHWLSIAMSERGDLYLPGSSRKLNESRLLRFDHSDAGLTMALVR